MRSDRRTWIAVLAAVAGLQTACFSETNADDPGCDTEGLCEGSTEGGSSDERGDESDSGSPASGLPCDVEAVLRDRCQTCHSDPPAFGAPMPLVTYDDLLVPAPSDLARSVFELAGERILDDARPMPPTGDLDPAEQATLMGWIEAGAPAGDAPSCEHDGDPMPDPVGPDALPCTPTHTFTAHADGSADEPFKVPTQGAENLYECFTFASPLAEGTQATAWAPIIDDERVLHHWILYKTKTPQADGGVGPCNMPSDATFVSGWAPGGGNYMLPDDVGLELGGPDDWFILQIHYHNTAHHDDSFDRSGVALCTAEEPRPNTAGVFTLGTLGINIPAGAENYTTSGTCPGWMTSYLPGPVNVIASFPHMHELGRSIRTDILRGGANGPIETLIDVETFNFETQLFYEHSPQIQVHPGDAVRTTCVYDNPYDFDVTFGEATEDEMCFNFAVVYPVEYLGENRQCGLL